MAESQQAWRTEAWLANVAAFAESLGIPAEHLPLIEQSLTHRSLTEESALGDNERLEFLGDSVLALLVNDYLFRAHPASPEGVLTRLKAAYVCEPSLARTAEALNLGSLVAMAPGDEAAGSRTRPSVLSDAVEAVLATIYLTRGLEAARQFVQREVLDRVDPEQVWDYKSRLQELLQERHRVTPTYRTVVDSGPAHDPVFRSEVLSGTEVLGTGTGRSKKLAEQAAAEVALAALTAPKRRRRKTKPSGSPQQVGPPEAAEA
jgi:ribonuclease-3